MNEQRLAWATGDPADAMGNAHPPPADPTDTISHPAEATNDEHPTPADPTDAISDPADAMGNAHPPLADPADTMDDAHRSVAHPTDTMDDAHRSVADPAEATSDLTEATSEAHPLADPADTMGEAHRSVADPTEATSDLTEAIGEAHPLLVDLAEVSLASAANAVRKCLKHHGQTLIPPCDIGINAKVTRHQWPLRTSRALYGGGTMDTIQLSPLRRELLEILKARGYRRLDQPIRLASGAMSSDFIDGKEALAEWRHLRLACEAIVEAVAADGHSFDAVGGLTLGADALAVGIAAVSDCRWFFVRKEPKKRGTRRLIEGAQIGPADTVLLVEDVVTTGGSISRRSTRSMRPAPPRSPPSRWSTAAVWPVRSSSSAGSTTTR